MKSSVWIVIAVVVVGIIAVVAFMSKHPSSGSANSSSPNSSSPAAVVTYTSSGFSPAMTTVKSGASVTLENKTSEEIQVDSDPHPVHTDDTDLNVGAIGAGQSKTVTLTKKGAFGFHNHLDPSDTARITIQ